MNSTALNSAILGSGTTSPKVPVYLSVALALTGTMRAAYKVALGASLKLRATLAPHIIVPPIILQTPAWVVLTLRGLCDWRVRARLVSSSTLVLTGTCGVTVLAKKFVPLSATLTLIGYDHPTVIMPGDAPSDRSFLIPCGDRKFFVAR